MPLCLTLHLAAISASTMLMWVVACLSYPLFAYVGRAEFVSYHEQHCQRITIPVGILLAFEISSDIYVQLAEPSQFSLLFLILTAIGIAITGAWAAPLHGKLGQGAEPHLLKRLQMAHLWRSCVWTLHLGLALFEIGMRNR